MYFFIDIIYVGYEALKKEEIFSAIRNDDNQERSIKAKITLFFHMNAIFL